MVSFIYRKNEFRILGLVTTTFSILFPKFFSHFFLLLTQPVWVVCLPILYLLFEFSVCILQCVAPCSHTKFCILNVPLKWWKNYPLLYTSCTRKSMAMLKNQNPIENLCVQCTLIPWNITHAMYIVATTFLWAMLTLKRAKNVPQSVCTISDRMHRFNCYRNENYSFQFTRSVQFWQIWV